MKNKYTLAGLAVLMLIAAFSGCTAKSEAPPPAPTTTAPVTTTPPKQSPPPPPPKPLPGIAYNQTGEYTMQDAPNFPNFTISTNWTKLTIEYYLNATASCYVIGSEPPTGVGTGPAPAITIKPPISSEFTFDLPPGPGSCGTAEANVIKHEVTVMANEIGQWTVTVTGRGQNVDLVLFVRGA